MDAGWHLLVDDHQIDLRNFADQTFDQPVGRLFGQDVVVAEIDPVEFKTIDVGFGIGVGIPFLLLNKQISGINAGCGHDTFHFGSERIGSDDSKGPDLLDPNGCQVVGNISCTPQRVTLLPDRSGCLVRFDGDFTHRFIDEPVGIAAKIAQHGNFDGTYVFQNF